MATDPVSSVRAAVGMNRHVPQAVRVLLARDPDPGVRRCAALRDLPPAVLHQLMADADRGVRQAALMTAVVHAPEATISAEQAAIFDDDPVFYRLTAMELVELTPQLLADLWTQPDLRAALARNPSLPPENMRVLLEDAGARVALAGNRGLPLSVVEELVATDDAEVHRELLCRTDLPDGLRRRLIAADEAAEPLPPARSLHPDHAGLAERLSYPDHPNPAFRRAVALSDDLPPGAVHRLAKDADFSTRLLICERPSDVPTPILVDLIAHWHGHSREDLLRHPPPAYQRKPCPPTRLATAPGTAKQSHRGPTFRPNSHSDSSQTPWSPCAASPPPTPTFPMTVSAHCCPTMTRCFAKARPATPRYRSMSSNGCSPTRSEDHVHGRGCAVGLPSCPTALRHSRRHWRGDCG
ncbi:hypothetical protein [Kutzneria buriramensis]|uniref:hypothetical protein n=1 Tax=Kutzneria buriramensis TaxID=1045776 RepID=UPI0011C0E4F0|nr:hypothetical protein [Kutzneria buriramensis]